MEERWRCSACGAEFERPARRWDCDDGLTATATDLCPRCGSTAVEELAPCPTCDGGWRRRDESVCLKCHLRHLGALRRFARQFSPAALADLDGILEGNGLEMFA